MEVASYIVFILLSLVGYSAGATVGTGKKPEVKPQIIDLIIIVFIWGVGIYIKVTHNLNDWLLVLFWALFSITVGIILSLPRKLSKVEKKNVELKNNSNNLLNTLWKKWKNFSKRIGSFQSRIILSLFFFLFFSPFAIFAKLFSEPLKIKSKNKKSYWNIRKKDKIGLKEFRRHF